MPQRLMVSEIIYYARSVLGCRSPDEIQRFIDLMQMVDAEMLST